MIDSSNPICSKYEDETTARRDQNRHEGKEGREGGRITVLYACTHAGVVRLPLEICVYNEGREDGGYPKKNSSV